MAPTLLSDVKWSDPVMAEEIFGPILPVLTYSSFDEVTKEVRSRSHPLAAYIFTRDRRTEERFLSEMTFGGGCVNDCVVQLSNAHLPFGGVGASGMGAYHGERSFLCFTHEKAIVHKSSWPDPWLRYAPYSRSKFSWLKKIMDWSRRLG